MVWYIGCSSNDSKLSYFLNYFYYYTSGINLTQVSIKINDANSPPDNT